MGRDAYNQISFIKIYHKIGWKLPRLKLQEIWNMNYSKRDAGHFILIL